MSEWRKNRPIWEKYYCSCIQISFEWRSVLPNKVSANCRSFFRQNKATARFSTKQSKRHVQIKWVTSPDDFFRMFYSKVAPYFCKSNAILERSVTQFKQQLDFFSFFRLSWKITRMALALFCQKWAEAHTGSEWIFFTYPLCHSRRIGDLLISLPAQPEFEAWWGRLEKINNY